MDQWRRPFPALLRYRRRKGSTPKVKQHGPSGAYPIVSLAALVKLADWYQAHQRPPQGVQPCANPSHGLIPPRAGNAPAAAAAPITPPQLWAVLPAERRQQALQTLSRIVTQQLRPLVGKEVRHEDC